VRLQLASSEVVLVCAAARALALCEDKKSGDSLAALLESTNAPVRRAVAEALSVCGSRAHAPRLTDALATAVDDFERHACILALLVLADEPFVRALLKHDSPALRRAALHLLDEPRFGTLRFTDLLVPLGDPDAGLSLAARQLLERHPSWARDALPWLRQEIAMDSTDANHAAALENLFVAFQSDSSIRNLISERLGPGSNASDRTRALLLDALPSLTLRPPEPTWLNAIRPAFTNAALRGSALRMAAAYPNPNWEPALAQLSEDSTLPASQRFLAARLSARQPALSEAMFALVSSSLRSQASAADRLSAVELLARARLSSGQLRVLLDVLRGSVPVPLEAILPALARATDEETRPVLGEFLLTRLKSGWSPARATLDPALAIFPEGSAVRGSLVNAWEQNNSAMRQRLSDFKPLLKGGDPERGREWFATAACNGCHRIGQGGGMVGPDLTKIGAIRSGEDLLESILYPSSSFAQGYEPYSLTRKDGEELSGNLVSQGPEGVKLRDATGLIYRVRADDIASLRRQQLSVMPEGLEQLLTREQFADLLAYLQSLR
jgi:putative heme-binding domain-containing protein